MDSKTFEPRMNLWIAVAGFLAWSTTPALAQDAADSVTAMCIDAGKTSEICECASIALHDDIGGDAYLIYENVGSLYLEDLKQGVGRADAWMAAIESENVELATSNEYGKAHRNAMTSCEP